MTGIELIAKERTEQLEKHGRSVDLDALYNQEDDMSHAAASFILRCTAYYPSNWDKDVQTKILNKPVKERLAIAGALIAAEIDRLNYIETISKL